MKQIEDESGEKAADVTRSTFQTIQHEISNLVNDYLSIPLADAQPQTQISQLKVQADVSFDLSALEKPDFSEIQTKSLKTACQQLGPVSMSQAESIYVDDSSQTKQE